jgi:hypothetical protein
MFEEHTDGARAVFKCLGCCCALLHARFMLPTSVRGARVLYCTYCLEQAECVRRGRMGHSTWERTAMRSLCTWQPWQPGSYDMVISETYLWADRGANDQLRNCRLDFLICTQEQARAREFKDAVCLFIDGQHHFPWLNPGAGDKWAARSNWLKPDEQRAVDRAITDAAVKLGYCVVRVCYKDACTFLSIVRAAWQKRHSAIALVSRHWNSGAHHPGRLERHRP